MKPATYISIAIFSSVLILTSCSTIKETESQSKEQTSIQHKEINNKLNSKTITLKAAFLVDERYPTLSDEVISNAIKRAEHAMRLEFGIKNIVVTRPEKRNINEFFDSYNVYKLTNTYKTVDPWNFVIEKPTPEQKLFYKIYGKHSLMGFMQHEKYRRLKTFSDIHEAIFKEWQWKAKIFTKLIYKGEIHFHFKLGSISNDERLGQASFSAKRIRHLHYK